MEDVKAYKLMHLVRDDLDNIVKRFEDKQCLRFTTFAEIWRELKFSHIYYKRYSVPEMMEFTEELFHLAKGVILMNSNIACKVGGFYLLSSLYRKQVLKNIVKIRVTLLEWKQLLELIKYCEENKHLDLLYIYSELCVDRAFQFVCTERPYGMEPAYRKYYALYNYPRKDDKYSRRVQGKKQVIDRNILEELKEAEKLYVSTKKALLGDKDLAYIDDTFSDKLIKNVTKSSGCDMILPSQSSSEPGTSIGVRRMKLKTKAFSGSNEKISPKSVDDTKKEDQLSPDIGGKKRGGKKKLHKVDINEDTADETAGSESRDLPELSME